MDSVGGRPCEMGVLFLEAVECSFCSFGNISTNASCPFPWLVSSRVGAAGRYNSLSSGCGWNGQER